MATQLASWLLLLDKTDTFEAFKCSYTMILNIQSNWEMSMAGIVNLTCYITCNLCTSVHSLANIFTITKQWLSLIVPCCDTPPMRHLQIRPALIFLFQVEIHQNGRTEILWQHCQLYSYTFLCPISSRSVTHIQCSLAQSS